MAVPPTLAGWVSANPPPSAGGGGLKNRHDPKASPSFGLRKAVGPMFSDNAMLIEHVSAPAGVPIPQAPRSSTVGVSVGFRKSVSSGAPPPPPSSGGSQPRQLSGGAWEVGRGPRPTEVAIPRIQFLPVEASVRIHVSRWKSGIGLRRGQDHGGVPWFFFSGVQNFLRGACGYLISSTTHLLRLVLA